VAVQRRLRDQAPLVGEGGGVRLRRVPEREPKRQHGGVHGGDQRDRRIGARDHAQHVADRSRRALQIAPQPALLARNAGEQKPSIGERLEVRSLEVTATLALYALASKPRRDLCDLR
jgi:hypothetical protein